MENLCVDRLIEIREEINNSQDENGYYGFNYVRLDGMKENGSLDKLYEEKQIDELFKKELIEFLSILYDKSYDRYPYHKKILLETSNLVGILKIDHCNYMLSHLINDTDAYRVIPKMIKGFITRYQIQEYINLSEEEIKNKLKDNMDIYDGKDSRGNHVIEFDIKPVQYYTNYDKYLESLNPNSVDVNDQTKFFIWSESKVYEEEKSIIRGNNKYDENKAVLWVAKDYGDGYGYDVLSYDYRTDREKVIEVKSGLTKTISITEDELKEVEKCSMKENSDYYIYKYYHDVETNTIKRIRLKLDKENYVFINIDDPIDDYYVIVPSAIMENKGSEWKEKKIIYIRPSKKQKQLQYK